MTLYQIDIAGKQDMALQKLIELIQIIDILGLECAMYCSKLFGLTHACGSNIAANDWQKDYCCD